MSHSETDLLMKTLEAGTILFHGTDSDDLIEADDSLDGPAWLSTSRSVATHFAKRSGGYGGKKRVVEYRLAEPVQLHEILSSREMSEFAEEYGISLCGVSEMRESVADSGISGWIIPFNYQDGDDVLIADTSALEYVATHHEGETACR